MKPIARQRRQPCVLGRYPQPVFLYVSASSSGTGRGKCAVGASVVGGRRVVFKGGAALSLRLIMLALTNVGLVWLQQGGQDKTTLIHRVA
jgi:hypothetical protein